jgi:hypothetical protein
MKYKIGDIVVYKKELQRYGVTSTRYVIKDIATLYDKPSYEVVYSNNIELVSPHVSAESFEQHTELDKSYIRETKINSIIQ